MSAVFMNKVSGATMTPVGSGGVTALTQVSSATLTQTRTEIEVPSSSTLHPIILPGGRRDSTLTIVTQDVDAYALAAASMVAKQAYTNVTVTGKAFDCAGTALNSTIVLSRAILSEVSELAISASGDAVAEYTLTFKGVGTCAGDEAAVTVTIA